MEGPLDKYRDKRDPSLTNEPFSAERSVRSEGETWAGRFVIHQHDATRMHFDVRLQIGGTLQSFAVPRGISLDPKDKHLAIHTEDHPLEYLHFEDVIPEGNYGAGAMIVWDTGGVTYMETSAEEGLKKGKIDFVLNGLKAKGRFAFIATGRRKADTGLAGTKNAASEWLLIKKPDDQASEGSRLSESMPRSIISGLTVKELPDKAARGEDFLQAAAGLAEKYPAKASRPEPSRIPVPMVCATEGAPQKSPDWIYELKLDGVRIIADKNGDEVRLTYRSGRVTTRNYADIARSLSKLIAARVILDGEIVTFDEAGKPVFSRLAPRIQARKQADIDRAEALVSVAYMVFDILQVGGHDLRSVPLEERKGLLSLLLPEIGLVRRLEHIPERGDALWQLCEAQGLEGMVAKRRGSAYIEGPQASGHWVKLKREEDAEFVVVGFTRQKNENSRLGALGLGSYVGDRLVYRGRVGSGFSDKARAELLAELEPQVVTEPAAELPDEASLSAVAPQLVVRIKSHGFTEDGHLRAAVFHGVVADKDPRECTAAPNDDYAAAPPPLSEPHESRGASPRAHHRRVTLSNRDKVYFPEDQITKGDLLDYYEAIAPTMLPHLAGRPVVLVRYPDGIHGKNFYQWRAPEGTPDWVRTFELYDDEKQEERGTGKAAFLVDSTDALLHIANLGCIPIHVLAGREGTREHCDFITIDFDIAERPFRDAVVMALSLRDILTDLKLQGFPKTSGQRGLHVLVPLGPGVPFASAKILCELLGRVLVGRHADIATMERRIDKRGGKLYVDTGQTGRSRTIVAPYSVRAYPGARVSTPLRWEELHLALDPGVFTILSVVDRVTAQGDPMEDLLGVRPDLPGVLQELGRWSGVPR